MQTIVFTASEVWDFFQENKTALLTQLVKIAENPETEIVVYLTSERKGSEILPSISVYLEDAEFYTEEAVNQRDCEQTVIKIYYEYLDTARLIDHLTRDDEEESDIYQQIDDREKELSMLVDDFVYDMLGYSLSTEFGVSQAEKIKADLLDHICEYLYQVHEVSVFRPMVLEDENGEDFISEYPYEDMEYDERVVDAYLSLMKINRERNNYIDSKK